MAKTTNSPQKEWSKSAGREESKTQYCLKKNIPNGKRMSMLSYFCKYFNLAGITFEKLPLEESVLTIDGNVEAITTPKR